ncbi:MAG: DUF975 family protein [Clostridiales bacterium]|nr:DUF975 family protein [Clostridiales bacterium]
MFYASDYRAIARRALRGNWGTAIGVGLVALLLGGGSGAPSWFQVRFELPYPSGDPSAVVKSPFGTALRFQLGPEVYSAIALAAVWSIIALVIGGAIGLGQCRYNTRLVRGERPPLGTLFSFLSDRKLKACGLHLMIALRIFLWTLLFIVPGIIAIYRYAMAPYVMAQDPDLSILEAIRQSAAMMRGRKARLFCLEFSFIGWSLLCIPTLGIGYLWLLPYTYAATAAFYMDASGRLADMPAEFLPQPLSGGVD